MPSQYFTCVLVLFIVHTESSGVKGSQQLLTNQNAEDPLEYKLTKLLDIHIGKESNNFQSSLPESIRSEVRHVLEGLRNELVDKKHLDGQPGCADRPDSGKDNNFQQQEVLKDILSEISWINKNLSKVLSTPTSPRNDDGKEYKRVKNFINKSPVGVSFDQLCTSPSVIHLYPTNLWKNSSYVPKNCKEIQLQGYNTTGIYEIQPVKTEEPFTVLCDMETRGGGWTHIQKRYDGSQDFYLNWREYKFGFGDLEREFWLGLENIHSLTSSEKNELLVEVVDRDDIKAYAHYKAFEVGPERKGYPLKILSGFSGDAGDSLSYQIGMKFSTKDFDQDPFSDNCAEKYVGAWWYKDCHYSNLNGKYRNTEEIPSDHDQAGLIWRAYRGAGYAHSKSRMLVRPAQP